MQTFGDAETITIGDLDLGDFVVEIPAQSGVRGARVDSGVRELRDDYNTWRAGPARRRRPVRSRVITFLDRSTGALNVPTAFMVVVRRPVAGAPE